MALSSTTRKWLRYALGDLKVMIAIKDLGSLYLRACAYHAQQAVKKAINAYLTHHQVRFPETPDIEDLVDLVAKVDPTLAKKLRAGERLTKYAIEYRSRRKRRSRRPKPGQD